MPIKGFALFLEFINIILLFELFGNIYIKLVVFLYNCLVVSFSLYNE